MYEKERRTDGENLSIKYYYFAFFFKIVLADAEEANKVIIIAQISESDTSHLLYPTNYSYIVPLATRVGSVRDPCSGF